MPGDIVAAAPLAAADTAEALDGARSGASGGPTRAI
jgi:hypothetical protein